MRILAHACLAVALAACSPTAPDPRPIAAALSVSSEIGTGTVRSGASRSPERSLVAYDGTEHVVVVGTSSSPIALVYSFAAGATAPSTSPIVIRHSPSLEGDLACLTTGLCVLVDTAADPTGLGNAVRATFFRRGDPASVREVTVEAPGNILAPEVAASADRFLVSWLDATAPRTAWLAVDGTISPGPTLDGFERIVDLACNPSTCVALEAYVEPFETRVRRIGLDGTVDPAPGALVASTTGLPTGITPRGDGWAAWLSGISGYEYHSLDASLALVDGPIPAHPTMAAGCARVGCVALGSVLATFLPAAGVSGSWQAPWLRSDHSTYDFVTIGCSTEACLGVYHDTVSHTTWAVWFDADARGGLRASPPFPAAPLARTQSFPASIFDGEAHLLAFVENDGVLDHVRTVRIAADGTIPATDGTEISDVPGLYSAVDAATLGDQSMIAWVRSTGSAPEVSVMQISPEGVPLYRDAVRIAGNARGCAVATGGTDYLVVYEGASGIGAARVNRAGTVLDTSPIVISTAGEHPDVEWGGDGYLVTWTEYRGSRGQEIVGRRVAGDGALLDGTSFVIASADGPQVLSRVALVDERFVVAWLDGRNTAGRGAFEVWAARVARDGTVVDLTGLPIFQEALATHDRPEVAVVGDDAVVIAHGQQMIPGEEPEDPFTLRHFLELAQIDPAGEVSATTVLRESAEIPFVSTIAASSDPARRRSLASYVRGVEESDERGQRVRSVFLEDDALGAPCTADGDCASGICADGVCCDRACGGACSACSVSRGAAIDGTCASTCEDDAGPAVETDAGAALDDAGAPPIDGAPPLPGPAPGGCEGCRAAGRTGDAPTATALIALLALAVAMRRGRR